MQSLGSPTPATPCLIKKSESCCRAKGIEGSPGEREVEKLLKGVATVGRMVEGWDVHGLIACHASATLLHRLKERGDVGVWGQNELAMLLHADTQDVIERLLWTPPGWPNLDVLRGLH